MLGVELPETVELVTVSVPPLLKMPPPPPLPATLSEMVESVTVSVPLLLKAPPAPEVFAPETVTPEIVRLPPVVILKMLKLRPALVVPEELSKPLMVSEEAPGPVMVRVPAVPVPTTVLALTIVGSEEPSVMVPVTLKSMMSSPGVVLAKVMAASRDPAPLAFKVVTVKVAGLILSSNRRSSGLGKPEDLCTFLF